MGKKITAAEIRAMRDGKLSENLGRGAGTLLLWKRSGAVRLFFRYAGPDGKQQDLSLGLYDSRGRAGLTLAEARTKAGELSRLYQSGVRDLRQHFADIAAAAQAARDAAAAAEQAERTRAEQRSRYTLRALLGAYVAHLEAQGKPSAASAASVFRVWVLEPHPALADAPAAEVSSEALADVLAGPVAAGKKRTPGVLRSYMRAAFGLALRAAYDGRIARELKGFGINSNPCDPLPAGTVRAGKRALSAAEMADYLRGLSTGEGLATCALWVAVLAGGQRIEQLLRARLSSWDPDSGILRLWDGKGRRTEPREHLLPVGPVAADLLDTLAERARLLAEPTARDPCLFMAGRRGAVLNATTVCKTAKGIAADMATEPFTGRDIRRTCETMLAQMGVSRDLRAQLLSHGLGGVQNLHYDRHSYISEKRAALVRWEQHLDGLLLPLPAGSTVVPMRRAG